MNDEEFLSLKQQFHDYIDDEEHMGEKRKRSNDEAHKTSRVLAYKRAKAIYPTLTRAEFARAMNINKTTFRGQVNLYDAKILAEAEALGWKSNTGIPGVLRTKLEVEALKDNGYTILCGTKDNRVKHMTCTRHENCTHRLRISSVQYEVRSLGEHNTPVKKYAADDWAQKEIGDMLSAEDAFQLLSSFPDDDELLGTSQTISYLRCREHPGCGQVLQVKRVPSLFKVEELGQHPINLELPAMPEFLSKHKALIEVIFNSLVESESNSADLPIIQCSPPFTGFQWAHQSCAIDSLSTVFLFLLEKLASDSLEKKLLSILMGPSIGRLFRQMDSRRITVSHGVTSGKNQLLKLLKLPQYQIFHSTKGDVLKLDSSINKEACAQRSIANILEFYAEAMGNWNEAFAKLFDITLFKMFYHKNCNCVMKEQFNNNEVIITEKMKYPPKISHKGDEIDFINSWLLNLVAERPSRSLQDICDDWFRKMRKPFKCSVCNCNGNISLECYPLMLTIELSLISNSKVLFETPCSGNFLAYMRTFRIDMIVHVDSIEFQLEAVIYYNHSHYISHCRTGILTVAIYDGMKQTNDFTATPTQTFDSVSYLEQFLTRSALQDSECNYPYVFCCAVYVQKTVVSYSLDPVQIQIDHYSKMPVSKPIGVKSSYRKWLDELNFDVLLPLGNIYRYSKRRHFYLISAALSIAEIKHDPIPFLNSKVAEFCRTDDMGKRIFKAKAYSKDSLDSLIFKDTAVSQLFLLVLSILYHVNIIWYLHETDDDAFVVEQRYISMGSTCTVYVSDKYGVLTEKGSPTANLFACNPIINIKPENLNYEEVHEVPYNTGKLKDLLRLTPDEDICNCPNYCNTYKLRCTLADNCITSIGDNENDTTKSMCGDTCGDFCLNSFSSFDPYPILVKKEGNMGNGAYAGADIPEGVAIGEYVGQIISSSQYKALQDKSYTVFMGTSKLGKQIYVNAGKYGNSLRNVNHCCKNPNTILEKTNVNGRKALILYSTRYIPFNTPLSFNYGWEKEKGKDATPCLCACTGCTGVMESCGPSVFPWDRKSTNNGLGHVGGIANLGASCYMTAVILVIRNTKQAMPALHALVARNCKDLVLCQSLLAAIKADLSEKISLREFAKVCLKYPALKVFDTPNKKHCDASEFLIALFDGIEQEIGSYFEGDDKDELVQNVLHSIFHYQCSSRLKCNKCQHGIDAEPPSPIMMLLLSCYSEKTSLEDLISEYFQKPQRADVCIPPCGKCHATGTTDVYYSMRNYPPNLLIEYSRAYSEGNTFTPKKSIKSIDFPLTLDLAILSGTVGNSAKYRLISVVHHKGEDQSCGHYVSDIYDETSMKWTYVNDGTLWAVTPEDVLSSTTSACLFVYAAIL